MPYICSFQRAGRAEGYLKGIAECLRIKFGPEGLDLMPEIERLEDHEVLLEVLETIETVQRPEDLRKVWKKRRKRKG